MITANWAVDVLFLRICLSLSALFTFVPAINNEMSMTKAGLKRIFGANQCQISNTIITPVFVSGWYSVPALNFNEDEY